tara:strand:+ start:8465 stop:9055 length:591 start_codon:yes stop_codon:yes gene_type:complete
MGHISAHPIRTWSGKHELTAFVETGTHLGAGIAFARQCNKFNEFHSVEINEYFYTEATHMFSRDDRVKIWHGASDDMLPHVLAEPSLQDKNILFWLDAHLPKTYKEWDDIDIEETQEQVAPLEQELKIIRELRPNNKDIIVVDDLRLYAKDNYEHQNCDIRVTEDTDWIYDLMSDAFCIFKNLRHEGYLILVPYPE